MTNAKVLRLTCPAPAKLNLFLHVVGRREDGYHLLQTVFRLIDFSDQLDFVLRHDGIVKLRSPIPGVPEDMTSPSLKRPTVARPRRILRCRTTSCASLGLALPVKTIKLS